MVGPTDRQPKSFDEYGGSNFNRDKTSKKSDDSSVDDSDFEIHKEEIDKDFPSNSERTHSHAKKIFQEHHKNFPSLNLTESELTETEPALTESELEAQLASLDAAIEEEDEIIKEGDETDARALELNRQLHEADKRTRNKLEEIHNRAGGIQETLHNVIQKAKEYETLENTIELLFGDNQKKLKAMVTERDESHNKLFKIQNEITQLITQLQAKYEQRNYTLLLPQHIPLKQTYNAKSNKEAEVDSRMHAMNHFHKNMRDREYMAIDEKNGILIISSEAEKIKSPIGTKIQGKTGEITIKGHRLWTEEESREHQEFSEKLDHLIESYKTAIYTPIIQGKQKDIVPDDEPSHKPTFQNVRKSSTSTDKSREKEKLDPRLLKWLGNQIAVSLLDALAEGNIAWTKSMEKAFSKMKEKQKDIELWEIKEAIKNENVIRDIINKKKEDVAHLNNPEQLSRFNKFVNDLYDWANK